MDLAHSAIRDLPQKRGIGMKKAVISILLLCIVSLLPLGIKAYEEKNLAPDLSAKPNDENASVIIKGYANARNVVLIGSVMGVTYHFCKEPKNDFCSDYEGIIVVSGSDTGHIPAMLRVLDDAMKSRENIIVKFSAEDHFMGVREILDVQTIKSTI
jgi:hypothetical protein